MGNGGKGRSEAAPSCLSPSCLDKECSEPQVTTEPLMRSTPSPSDPESTQDPSEPAQLPPGRAFLPSAAVLGPSSRVVPVLFFLRCFFLLACGDGGGSSFGLAALEMFGLELSESAVPLAGDKEKASHAQQDSDSLLFPGYPSVLEPGTWLA